MRLVFRQAGADLIDHIHGIGIGLAKHRQHYRALVVEPGGNLVVGDAVAHIGNLAEPDRRAVAEGHDQWAELFRIGQLPGGFQRHILAQALQRADGGIGIGGGHGIANVVQRHAARCRLVRIDANANRVFLLAENQHLGDAGQLRNLLRKHLLAIIIDGRKRLRRR